MLPEVSFIRSADRASDQSVLVQNLVRQADEAMGQAKKAGRSRVEVYLRPEDTASSMNK
ncbi:MAG: hypothetical protein Q7J51_01385 [Sheuella sp.]|nr:hypothetical protein [Sheuella sp.]